MYGMWFWIIILFFFVLFFRGEELLRIKVRYLKLFGNFSDIIKGLMLKVKFFFNIVVFAILFFLFAIRKIRVVLKLRLGFALIDIK